MTTLWATAFMIVVVVGAIGYGVSDEMNENPRGAVWLVAFVAMGAYVLAYM